MKIILTMLTLAFATQVSAGNSCQSNDPEEEGSTKVGVNGAGTWNDAARN